MVDFTPGIARAKAAGYKIDAAPYPDGPAGIRQSLEVIARKSRDGRLDPDIRGWAGDTLIAAGKPQGVRAQAQVLVDAFRRETLYISDPIGAEYIAGGAATMCLRPGLCVRARDCDDGVVFMASALMSLGYHVRVIKQNFGPEHQEHVLLEVQDESGNWLPVDPSTDLPVGSSHQAVEEVRLDPMQQVGSTGTAGAEIVTLGAPPRTPFKGRALFYKGNHWYEFRYGRWWVHADGRWHMGPGEPPVGIGESYCGSCSGAGASLVEGGQHPNDPPKLASAVWEVIRPYQEQQAHVGFGDLPAGNWVMVPDLTVQAGSRYVVIIGAPPKGLIFKDPWTQDDARNYFEPNWSIESLSRQDVDSASDTAWQMQGIARRSTQLTASPDAAKVSTAILWKESTPSPPAKKPPGAPPDTLSTGTMVAIGVAAGVVVIGGGVALYKWKRRKRGGPGGTVKL